jgi:hypothetical protein
MTMKNQFITLWTWIRQDFASNPWRVAGECYNWMVSVLTAIIFAATVPNPPLLLLYPLWLSGLIIMCFCARSRGSFGLFMGCISMAVIDIIGYVRLLVITFL